MKNYIGFTEFGMAVGVYEELLVFGAVSLLAFYFPGKLLYAVWFGFFMALAAHFCVHIGHTLYIRKYIPSFITSAISLPISVLILVKASAYMEFDLLTYTGIFFGIAVLIINFFMLHAVMHRVNAKINSSDKNYNKVPIPGRF